MRISSPDPLTGHGYGSVGGIKKTVLQTVSGFPFTDDYDEELEYHNDSNDFDVDVAIKLANKLGVRYVPADPAGRLNGYDKRSFVDSSTRGVSESFIRFAPLDNDNNHPAGGTLYGWSHRPYEIKAEESDDQLDLKSIVQNNDNKILNDVLKQFLIRMKIGKYEK